MAIIPTHVQHYRGTTAQHAAYTGPVGELTVDTDKKVVVVQDGATAGGVPMAKEGRKVISGDAIIKINGGTEATLAQDITVTADVTALQTAVEPTTLAPKLISTDAGNAIVLGDDGLLEVQIPEVVAGDLIKVDDAILSTTAADATGKIQTTIGLKYDQATGKLDLLGKDGSTVVATATVLTAASVLEDVQLVTDPIDPEGDGIATKSGTFIDFDFILRDGSDKHILLDVTGLIDVYTGGDGIIVTGKVISVKTSSSQAVYVDGTGALAVGVGKGLKITAGADGANGTVDPDFPNMISTDAGNSIVAGTDGALFSQAVTAGDGITVTAGQVAANLAATGNQLQIDDTGALVVPTDYGTMG